MTEEKKAHLMRYCDRAIEHIGTFFFRKQVLDKLLKDETGAMRTEGVNPRLLAGLGTYDAVWNEAIAIITPLRDELQVFKQEMEAGQLVESTWDRVHALYIQLVEYAKSKKIQDLTNLTIAYVLHELPEGIIVDAGCKRDIRQRRLIDPKGDQIDISPPGDNDWRGSNTMNYTQYPFGWINSQIGEMASMQKKWAAAAPKGYPSRPAGPPSMA